MGIALLVLILIVLAFVGNWFYKFRHLNEDQIRAMIDETEIMLAKLSEKRAEYVHDSEKQHICDVVINHQAKRLRRLERRLSEFGVHAK